MTKYKPRVFGSELERCVAKGDLDGVKRAVARGYSVHANDWDGPFHLAVSEGHLEICRYLLSVEPTLVNEWAGYDEIQPPDTPLGLAIKSDSQPMIALLLDHGADVSGTDAKWGETWIPDYLLQCAEQVGNEDVRANIQRRQLRQSKRL